MALKTILNKQTDFTGEFPEEWAKGGLWRFNESDPDEDDCLLDSSGMGRAATISNWSGTSASLSANRLGNYFRMNIVNPSSEQNYLKVTNDGSIFASLGERIVCGGWMNPTTYSVGNTYCPIFNTRYGPGQPIFYLSLIRGKPRIMLYNDTGSLILDESVEPPFSLVNGGWYFIACLIEPDNKTAQYVVGNRGSGTVWASEKLSFTGELNRSCTADLILGMHADSYWYAGGLDDWVFRLRYPAHRRRFGKLLPFLPQRQRRRYLRGCGRHHGAGNRHAPGIKRRLPFGRCADHSGGGL